MRALVWFCALVVYVGALVVILRLGAFVVDREPSLGRVIGYGQYRALVCQSVLHGG